MSSVSSLPRSRRFRVDVGTLISALVLAQSLLLIALVGWGAQRLVASFGEGAQRANHQRVQEKVEDFLARASTAVDAMVQAPHLAPAGSSADDTAELLWVLLQQAPELDSLYVADARARMLMVQRYPDLAVRHIVRGHDATTETWDYKVRPDLRLMPAQRFATTRQRTITSDYDPLAGPWYRQATQAGRPVWTAPYEFQVAHELGVTYARPDLRTRDNDAPDQVAAGDVTLGRLSDFVRQFARAGEGDSALLSADLRVLARSDRPGRITRLELPSDGVLAALREPLARAGATSFALTYRGERYLVQTSVIVATGWRLVSWVPEERVLGGVHRAVGGAMAAALGLLGVVLLLSLRLARRVTAPVERLAEFARRIGRLELDGPPPAQSRVLEIQHLAQALDDSARGLRAFRQFVPVQLVRQLMAQGLPLGANGQLRRVTIMFTDIAGFTGLAEGMPAPVLVAQLTDYFNLTAAVIARHGGTIDKYIGDGMMVLWGAPAARADAELSACRAALELQAAVDAFNADARAASRVPLPTRIGIHTGPVIAGALGSNDRLAYTAIGDAVNVASRIEELNTALGTRILISEATWEGVAGRLPARRIATEALLRGRQAPLTVYALIEDAAGQA